MTKYETTKFLPVPQVQKYQNLTGYYNTKTGVRKNLYDSMVTTINENSITICNFWNNKEMTLPMDEGIYLIVPKTSDDYYKEYPETVIRLCRNLLNSDFDANLDTHTMDNSNLCNNLDELIVDYFKEDGRYEIVGIVFDTIPHYFDEEVYDTGLVIKYRSKDEDKYEWFHVRRDIAEELRADAKAFLSAKGVAE